MSGDDRTTIGLTPENKETLDRIMENFNEKSDAAKFAIAIAIESEVKPGETNNTETVWNVGSFDPDRELQDLVLALYPSEESPYTTVEHFVNQGITQIDEHLDQNKNLNIIDFLR